MQIHEFKSVISTFSDPETEMLFEKTKILFSMNGELIEATLSSKSGEIQVDDGNGPINASNWIITRLANLPLLASRLRERVAQNDCFVTPAATLLESLQVQPDEKVIKSEDAVLTTFEALNERSPLETTVLYITSDAGEGKTSLINEMAYGQAKRFLDKQSDWLLVPIPLGGRHFLRFDDITVGALQNRYRFPFLYYSSFLALVRMGVIIPAFDGFEEMFVENSSGEALSAMGNLVGALNSTGTLIIAARKAYFEFENLQAQEKLYDAISDYDVGFGKLELHRWTKKQFLEYCDKRKIEKSKDIYCRVSERLGEDHSLLTRPVLVRRLVDIAEESTSLDSFLSKMHESGADFFSVFVRGIIEREASEKWIDRSGESGSPLITVDEHCELLAHVALGMWESRVDYLKRDHLDFVADYFCEIKRKTPMQTQQIRERIRGHALLVASSNVPSAVEFDHAEFRSYFLGEGLAKLIKPQSDKAKTDVLAVMRKGVLSENSQIAFIRSISRDANLNCLSVAEFLFDVGGLDGQASYTQENCGVLSIRLLNKIDANGLEAEGIAFGNDSLRDSSLVNVTFTDCYFSPTSLEITSLKGCTFLRCKFTQLKIYNSTSIDDTTFDECLVDSVRLTEKGLDIWEPTDIISQLIKLGASFGPQQSLLDSDLPEIPDKDMESQQIEKLLRYFMRSTHISESVIQIKLGDSAKEFINNVVPDLLDANILCEIENRGGSMQRRFKLGLALHQLNEAISSAQGKYDKFLKACKEI